jgi:hypothetical protein
MLDLNHPQAKYIFAVANEDGIVLSVVKRMTLVDTRTKLLLLPRAEEAIGKMRIISIEGWGEDKNKFDAINLLHRQITEFANICSTNDYATNWQGKICTVCASEITNLANYKDMLYCRKCLDFISGGRSAVDHAFCLWGI